VKFTKKSIKSKNSTKKTLKLEEKIEKKVFFRSVVSIVMPSANRESVGHLSPVTEVMVASDSASYMFLLTS